MFDGTNILLIGITCFYAIILLALIVLAIVDLAVHRKELTGLWRYGLIFGGILLALDLAVLIAVPRSMLTGPLLVLMPVISAMAFGKMFLFGCVGMYSCQKLRRPGLLLHRPIVLGRLGPERVNMLNFTMAVLGVVTVAVVFSCVLFKLTNPQMSPILRRMSGLNAGDLAKANEPSLLITLVVLEFAFAEEVIFRMGIQSFLARHFSRLRGGYWIALAVTAAVWTLAHAGSLDPMWVKFVQVLPLGIGLGLLHRKYGLESCILAHGAFNVIMMLLASSLLKP